MSLDCIWILPKKNQRTPESFQMLNIKRSFFYANETLAFKGDIYSEWLEYNLGYTLYQEKKDIKKVKELNEKLQNIQFDIVPFKGENNDELTIKEIKDFIIMWNECSNLNATLVGWW
jgi:hypothetical protein